MSNELRSFEIHVEVKVTEVTEVMASSEEEALEKFRNGDTEGGWFNDDVIEIDDPTVVDPN